MKWSVYSPILTHNRYEVADEFIKNVRSLGITAVEVMSTELREKSLKEFKDYYSRFDLDIMGFILFTSFAEKRGLAYEDELQRVYGLLDSAAENGIRHVMVVPSVTGGENLEVKLAARDIIVAGMKCIVEYAGEKGILVSMENYSLLTHPYSTIEDMVYLMEHVPGLRYTLDAGNFYCVKEDVLEAYEKLKKYMIHVHIKDWKADQEGYIMRPDLPILNGCAPGTGLVPIKELLTRMKRDVYKGGALLEVNVVRKVEELKKIDIETCVDYLRKYDV